MIAINKNIKDIILNSMQAEQSSGTIASGSIGSKIN